MCTKLIGKVFAFALISVCGAPVASAQPPAPPDGFETCKALADNQARLDCFKRLLTGTSPGTPKAEEPSAKDSWRLIRTPDPRGGPDALALMRTADMAQSDPDLAGLMIRCQEKRRLEVQLALVRPFPPRSKRDVALDTGKKQSVLRAEASQAGTALILPVDATAFTIGPWQGLSQLAVKISDPEADVRGVIPLDGIVPALAKLAASCPPG